MGKVTAVYFECDKCNDESVWYETEAEARAHAEREGWQFFDDGRVFCTNCRPDKKVVRLRRALAEAEARVKELRQELAEVAESVGTEGK